MITATYDAVASMDGQAMYSRTNQPGNVVHYRLSDHASDEWRQAFTDAMDLASILKPPNITGNKIILIAQISAGSSPEAIEGAVQYAVNRANNAVAL